ncbi:MAG: BBP7 family outer membrane beta-barrel protein [Gemmataceae bacterium]
MHSRILGLLALTLVGSWAAAQQPTPINTPAPPPSVVTPPGVNTLNGAPPVPSLTAVPTGQPILAAESALGPTTSGPIFYANAEYLLWKVQDGVIPATASTLPVGVVAIDYQNRYFSPAGALIRTAPVTGYVESSFSNAATFGFGSSTDTGSQSGTRFSFGYWADSDMSFGVEGVFLYLAQSSDRFAGRASVANDQFIINTGFAPTDFLVDADGATSVLAVYDALAVRQASSTLVGTTATAMWGAEINTRCMAFRVGGCDIGTIAGFRYLGFKDEMNLYNSVFLTRPAGVQETATERTVSLSNNLVLNTSDRTRIWNHFYGGQFGVDFDWNFGSLFVYSRFKAGFGGTRQVADVNSTTSIINNEPTRLVDGVLRNTSPPSSTSPGGLLSAPGDNGRHERNVFSFVPEINLKVGYYVTDWFKIHAGYDWLWMTNVARAGASVTQTTLQTNVNVGNTNETINVTAPAFRFQNSDVWIQGVNFGLEFLF